ncbi:translation initiation factor IF-3 [Candidatus Dependentiae bacterium]|nr:MAG: translation initiation factor IF-3 [Candidatus Dependentiae bacterium]
MSLKDKRELLLINEQIRAQRVQLIDRKGENLGVVSRGEALRRAVDENLDLVMIADKGKDGVPVVKIMDFGKVLYERKKKSTQARKKQKTVQIKEIKLSPKIGEHDYQTKMKHVVEFLKEGKKVKITLFFKGRENIAKQDRGAEFFDKISKTFEEYELSKDLLQEKDVKVGRFWSRIYYLKKT